MAQKPISDSHIEIEETDQANNLVATYITSPSGEKGRRVDIIIPRDSTNYARSILNAFLPAGYPHSVTSDYLEYQIYDSLQAFSSSIAGMLSSRAVLEGIGVGDSGASPTAALLLSVLQESMGRIATILFAHRLGTSLEPECKMYRLAADIFNDAAMILDCLSPALPKASRVMLLSLSSVLRALCGVAAGSSKASLSAHFATQGNLGELNAKDSSQETIISLLGMLAGSLVVSRISTKLATWTAMIFLLAIHLGTNYLAVRAVCMRTLNRQRANLAFSTALDHVEKHADNNNLWRGLIALDTLLGPTPNDIRRRERVFEEDGVLRWNGEALGHCKVGVDLGTLLSCFNRKDETTGSYTDAPDFGRLLTIFNDVPYIIWFDEPNKMFLVVLGKDASPEAELSAWLFALYFAKHGKEKDEVLLDALKRTLEKIRGIDRGILGHLERVGWDTKTSALETQSGTRIKRPAHPQGFRY
ncbi:DUF647-domain-containing protein [Mollisia scopiformis]|uniref:DUF647-domain-containing protein n=1 Tax=Mollisia scopiformis TaxID=149040 RepID=A0A194WWL1_MOLSC|nr:DUF647-domain-containing protein [Mollisia scopiformis]KUJ12069.1 DUF647-domain-containing protein [Mollisia scopiformis]